MPGHLLDAPTGPANTQAPQETGVVFVIAAHDKRKEGKYGAGHVTSRQLTAAVMDLKDLTAVAACYSDYAGPSP